MRRRESDKVDFQTGEQCSYAYKLYTNCIESRRTPIQLSRRKAEASTSEIFSKHMEMKRETSRTCRRMRSVLYSRIIDQVGGKQTGGGQR